MPKRRTSFGNPIYENCGTYGGWQRHRKYGTEECKPCNTARNKYMQKYRKDAGLTSGTWVYVPHEIELTDDHYSI